MRYETKTTKRDLGYAILVTDTQGIRRTEEVYLELFNCSNSGSGWRTFTNFDGSWECHDEPHKTKKAAIITLQKYGV